MSAEKELVNVWLHNQGFFTISSLNAGGNRTIDFIALRQGYKQPEEVWHVEVHASISAPQLTLRERSDLAARFNNPNVELAMQSAIHERLNYQPAYKKVLITTIEGLTLPDIMVIPFEDALLSVFSSLDRSAHTGSLRTLQLVKYILLRRGALVRKILLSKNIKGVGNVRRQLFVDLLSSEDGKALLASKQYESLLIDSIAGSSLANSEKFAKLLATKILSKRARTAFLKELIPQALEEDAPKEQSLNSFIS